MGVLEGVYYVATERNRRNVLEQLSVFNGSFCSAGCNYHTHSFSQIKKRRRVPLRGDPVKHCIYNTVHFPETTFALKNTESSEHRYDNRQTISCRFGHCC